MGKKPKPKANLKSTENAAFLIDNILRFGRGSGINKIAAIHGAIQGAPMEARWELLQLAANSFGVVESADKLPVPSVISDGERDELKIKYGKTVDAMLDALVQANPSETEFYRGVHGVIDNPFFATSDARIFALYYILIDSRVPYFQLPQGLRMADDEFEDRLRKLLPLRMRLNFVLARNFDQRTEEADILIKLLLQEEEDRNRVVLLATILHTLRKEAGGRRAIDRLLL